MWGKQIEVTMAGFQHDTVMLVKRGYDGSSVEDRWTFPNALMFTLSLITTIGYIIHLITLHIHCHCHRSS